MIKTALIAICSVIFLFWPSGVKAQDASEIPQFQFSSKNEVGAWFGMGSFDRLGSRRHNTSGILELSSTNGVRFGRAFVGVGVGIRKWNNDYFLPVFGTASFNLWRGKNSLFLHLDLGHQFGSRPENLFGDKETGSFFAAYGVGYDFSVAKRTFLYLKASMCHQRGKAVGPYSGLGPSTSKEAYDLTYLFLRISVGVRIH